MKARTLSWVFGLILLSQVSAQKWPTKISTSQNLGAHSVVETEKGYLYETKSYRIAISQKIEPALVSNFVISAESVALALKSIPLPLFSYSGKEKPLIQIALNEQDYYSLGGAKGTAGFYSGRTQKVIIQWDQLNRSPAQSKLIRRPAFDLLVHELTHLCMHDTLWKMDQWLIEGVAEYLAAAHLVKGKFDFSRIDALIRDHLRKQNDPEGQEIFATNIELLLDLSSRDWLTRTAKLPPKEALESYTAALLLTHYAFHGGAERRNEALVYLEKLKKVTQRREPKPILFSQKNAAAIQKQLKAYWMNRGIRLAFK